ncbi:uncharacterized protein LOC129951069 isoform X2 [Eupeodes corollae]|uniref:uncharacterized protein LOC129951069 isoform X2 n=1 Tax=Eupeodes corollae TaxID=290404 RepID=UPI00248F51CD|nr:uncharacterized protein LOC129951069 isoform X2 [Eupeodes corollae]
MEDIEYLEEYEDFILPKTLNYSEEFPVNTIEGDLLNEPCNNFETDIPADGLACNDNMSHCSPLTNPKTTKNNLIKIINSEVLRAPAQVDNFNKGPSSATSITQHPQYRYERQNASFLDRITQNSTLQRLDKYKSVATVKPTLQQTKTFKLSSISPPFVPTDAKFQTISNLDCISKLDGNVSNKEDDSFLDYAVEKHAVDDFSMEFNLDTAEISDICSDSLNFSDDYNEDIFGLETLLSSEDTKKQKCKRKNMNDTVSKAEYKKFKYGSSFNSSKEVQKSGKHKSADNFTSKSSINQKQLKGNPTNVEKKKSQLSFEKKKISSSGKLVVKKNGKKFLFPDRSKFSLKKMTSSTNHEDETQSSLTTKIIDAVPQVKTILNTGETNMSQVNNSCTFKNNNQQKSPIEKSTNIKSPKNPDTELLKGKDKVIFSSPKNMKRIDSETPIHHHQSQTTPIKSTGISFGHFSLKSIKPPSNLKVKEIPLKPPLALPNSESNVTKNQFEDKVNKRLIEPAKCVSNPEKNIAVVLQENPHPTNDLSSKGSTEKETCEHNEPVSSSNNKDKLLKTSENILDSSYSKKDTSLEKVVSQKISNDKNGNTNVENINERNLREKCLENFGSKTNVTHQIVNETFHWLDTSLKYCSNGNKLDAETSTTKDIALETQSKDLDSALVTKENSLDNNVQITPKKVTEILNSNNAIETFFSTENNHKEKNCLKTNVPEKKNLVQEAKNLLDCNLSTKDSSISAERTGSKSPTKHHERKYGKQSNRDRVTEKCLENINKFLLNSSGPKIPQNTEMVNNEKPQQEHLFEQRGFDIRLSKNIVAKLLKSAKTCLNLEPPKLLDESKKVSTKSDVLITGTTIPDSTLKTSQRLSTDSADNTAIKTKGKRGRKKKATHVNTLDQSNIKPPPLVPDSTENISSKTSCLSDHITCEKQSVQNVSSGLDNDRIPSLRTENLTKDDPKVYQNIEVTSNRKEQNSVQKSPCNVSNQPKVSPLPTSAENTNIENNKEESSPTNKNTRLLKPKDKSQSKQSEVTEIVKEKELCLRKDCTSESNPVALAENCISFQNPAPQKSTKAPCDVEIVEPKKENNDDTGVLQFRPPTNLLSNDSFLNKIKLNVSPEINITDSNGFTSSTNSFGPDQNNPKFKIFELPAFIVMKTKIITRKDLEINKTFVPPVIKQDTESESGVQESVVKNERPEFSSVCARINSLLEQNANYLKFASGSERLTRMNDVLGDYSLSLEDANCTLKFLQSYLSSGPRDKAIKTRGQQFIPIYDSQKKIIGYRKRTIHVKPLSSRRSSRRTAKVTAQSAMSVTTVNLNRNSDTELPPKIEPELDVGESELIVPDTSPANDVCIKNEEDK